MHVNIEECRKLAARVANSLPKYVDPDLEKLPSQIPFRVICLNSILIHRIAHLSQECIDLHAKKYVISSLIIARAAMETAALLYLLDKKIIQSLETTDTVELERFIKKATIGSRNGDTEDESVNILTAINHIARKYPEYGYFYRDLSEYCHPNFAGLLGAYADLSEDKSKLALGPKNDLGITSIEPLTSTLMVAEHYYGEVKVKHNDLLGLCKCT